jgi:YVTN family beta-propeller protein
MLNKMKYTGLGVLLLLFLFGCSEMNTPIDNLSVSEIDSPDNAVLEKGRHHSRGSIVVANRASGSISVIDVRHDVVSGTYTLPAAGTTPEPMYVVFVNQTGQVIVGDRANNRLVVYNSRSFDVEGTVDVGAGVFHMWADQLGKQLWVNNDIDNTTSVINPRTLQVIATVPTPADLVAMGGKPHDVILGPFGRLAYVSVIGVSGANDYVVQFDTRTFQETGRTAVGKDPHLSLTRRNRTLYVPCQGNDAVYLLNRFSMNVQKVVTAPGAHGAGMPMHGKTFYTTNLPGGGSAGLIALDTRSNTVIGSSDTPYPVPHNIAITKESHKLYVTHSGGTSDKVTVYAISPKNPLPVLLGEVIVEFNPFGLAYVK